MLAEPLYRVGPILAALREVEAAEEAEDASGDEAEHPFDEELQVADYDQAEDRPPELADIIVRVLAVSDLVFEHVLGRPYGHESIEAAVHEDEAAS